MQDNLTLTALIIDSSGSMQSRASDIVGSIKETIRLNKETEGDLALQKLEFDITKKLLEQKIECEKEKRELLSSTLGQIFRTPTVRETVSKNMLATSTSYDYNNRECKNNYTIPVVETKTTEELP